MGLGARNAVGLALTCGACLLAYRHGQLAASHSECKCGRVSANVLQHEEDEVDMTPQSEQMMVSCMLEMPGMRSVLLNQLRTCLHEKGALDPAMVRILFRQPPPSLPATRLTVVEGRAPPQRTQAQAQPIVDGAGNSRTGTQSFGSETNASPADPLLAALWAARKAEEELPSAPLAQGRAAAPVPR